jgi:hypothetical protein
MSGARILRVDWLPGADRLRGSCHCGATAEAGDPIAMWDWLLAHPDHPADGPSEPVATPPPGRPPAHLITGPGQILTRGSVR